MRMRRRRPELADRTDAGRRLARRLEHRRADDPVVLGLPRGGVPVAYEVALALDAPLDVIVVRKLGVPSQPELAMGAIGEDGVRVLDRRLIADAGITDEDVARVEQAERTELEGRVAGLRRSHPRCALAGRTAIVVDDGLATGSTARAACRVARGFGASVVVLAVPVAPPTTVAAFADADELVVGATPTPFIAVGAHYRDFAPTTDATVMALLDRAAARRI